MGVTLLPWCINHVFRLITLLLYIVCKYLCGCNPHLLIRSGNIKTNPGPYNTKSSNVSFGVWNLDSIPARDYARIPFIETLQATCNFDIFGICGSSLTGNISNDNIFGICESSLTGNISNDDIFISGFSPQPSRSDKPALLRMGVFVYIIKKIYLLRNGVTLRY